MKKVRGLLDGCPNLLRHHIHIHTEQPDHREGETRRLELEGWSCWQLLSTGGHALGNGDQGLRGSATGRRAGGGLFDACQC
jgi:hypothetical protein